MATQRSGSLSRGEQDLLSHSAFNDVSDNASAKSNDAEELIMDNALQFDTQSQSGMPTDGHGNGRKEGRRSGATDEGGEDDDDIVAITGEDATLQEGGYHQVGGNGVRLNAKSKSKADRAALVKRISINLLIIASWFFFSTLMNLYNSWLFSKKRKNFVYPLFTTSVHMVVQLILSCSFMFLCRHNRKIVPRRRNGKRARPSAHDYVSKVMPCALATALDIGLSNLSLKTITLTFYTMCKSSNLAFVLLFAVLFGLEKLRLTLIGIIALITIGVVMMVAAETEFVLEGAVEVLTASAMGGLRWALMQMLLKRKAMGMSNPIATMFWLSPLMGVFMLFGSLMIESWRDMFNSTFFADPSTSLHTIILLVTPGVIVFCMNLCEFTLIQRTSVITLSVAGIFKEIMTIFISSTVFGDELTPINVSGLCIAILGITLYNYWKYRLLMGKGEDTDPHSAVADGEEDDEEDDDDDDEQGRAASRYTELDGRRVSTSPSRGKLSSVRSTQAGRDRPARYDTLSEADAQRTVIPGASEESARLLTTEGQEQRRKRDEEADMTGWRSSGFERTGNGYDNGCEYESDTTA